MTEREDIHVHRAQILHHFNDLLDGLTHAEDDARLRENIRGVSLGEAKDAHDPLVPTPGPRLLVQARHGLSIVIIDLRPGIQHVLDGVAAALKVRYQYFHRAARHHLVDQPDGLVKMVRAEVRQIIAIHRRDHGMAKTHCCNGACHLLGFREVETRRPPVRDSAIGAVSGADIAKNHERGGPMVPAFADVRAARLFTDRVESKLPHHPLDAEIVLTPRRLHLQPGWLSFGQRLGTMAAEDLVQVLFHGPAYVDITATRRERR